MRIVVALGGNALLRRGQQLTAENQRENARAACRALAPLALEHELVIAHGNGPRSACSLQGSAYTEVDPYPLDVLGAQTEGMIGYLLEQELGNELPPERPLATRDPADRVAAPARGRRDLRRGRRDPTMHSHEQVPAGRRLVGIEGVIDKDLASALLAIDLGADALVILTDVDAVYADWGTPDQRPIRHAAPSELRGREFAEGSMGPKVRAACMFVEKTGGRAAIGSMLETADLVHGRTGTTVSLDAAAVAAPAHP